MRAANPNLRASCTGRPGGQMLDNIDLVFDNVCPICGNGFVMGSVQNQVEAFYNAGFDGDSFDVICVHRCPVCDRLFVTKHVVEYQCGDEFDEFVEKSHVVFPSSVVVFDTYIEGLREFSPRFYELYLSAVRADSLGMTGVVGNIFRIALECLVKDYAKYLKPDDVEKIEKMDLAKCIGQYFADVPVEKTLATAIRKIGNGYTHYVCEFDYKDVQNMRSFLETLCLHVYHVLRANNQLELAMTYVEKRVK